MATPTPRAQFAQEGLALPFQALHHMCSKVSGRLSKASCSKPRPGVLQDLACFMPVMQGMAWQRQHLWLRLPEVLAQSVTGEAR